jgi:hypothetical protein
MALFLGGFAAGVMLCVWVVWAALRTEVICFQPW